ncbi:MAG: Mrp/NBP35 family ATP-binding protein [Sphingomicrobium sp.]
MTTANELIQSLPHADRVRSLRIKSGVATAIVDVGGLDPSERDALEEELRAALLKIEGVEEARIALTAADPRRTVIAVGSGKGGVGKSTMAANLAIALARSGRKVGLIDADVYGPSQPTLLGHPEQPGALDEQLIPIEAHGIRFLSLGNLVKPGQALAWRGPMASGALAKLIEAQWGDCEILIVDLPPGTGDVQITLVQKLKPDGAVIVSTPQDLSLIDAERAVDLFNRVQVPILGLIENMAGYQCPHCGKESEPFGTGGAEDGAKRMHIPFLGRLPLSLAIRTASDAGLPPALEEATATGAFATIAARILKSLEKVGG